MYREREPSIPNLTRLAYRVREIRPALLLGAGASIESGGHTAQDITWGILRKLYGTKPEQKLQNLFETEYNRPISFEDVLDALGTSSGDRLDMIRKFFKEMLPSEGYRYLAALLKAGYFYPLVLTTNFDHMLEDALNAETVIEEDITVRVLTAEELISPSIEPCYGEVIIVKLHGDISKPESLKTTALETMSLPEIYEKLVIRICEQHGLVVVGYRVKDIGVRNALQRAKPSAKGLFWVSKGSLDTSKDREILLLLHKHNSRNNIISNVTFDGLFKELGLDLVKVEVRKKHTHKLNEAWILLDRARSFGGERQEILQRLNNLSKQLLQEIKLEEVLALREFVQYELDKSGESYRLQVGVQLLENAIEGYSKYMERDDLIDIECALLGELLTLFLTGDQIPGGRLPCIEHLIMRAETLLNEIPRQKTMTRSRVLIALIEALKEKSMITEESEEQIETYMKAQAYGEDVISLLKDRDDSESKYLIGMAYRHIAVIYELEGDMASNEDERVKLYERWRQNSSKAVDILTTVGEDAVRGYALMNLASSYTKLCEFEVSDRKKNQLLEAAQKNLEESIRLLRGVEDHRGIGWSFVHLCENTRRQLTLSQEDYRCSVLLLELESYANRALAELKQVEDHLAQGLAYEQLGIALSLAATEVKGGTPIKLERSVVALQESINKLKATGFYRGTGEALFWLGKCQFSLWEQTSNVNYLLRAVQSLVQGVVSTAAKLEVRESLVHIYRLLETEIRKVL